MLMLSWIETDFCCIINQCKDINIFIRPSRISAISVYAFYIATGCAETGEECCRPSYGLTQLKEWGKSSFLQVFVVRRLYLASSTRKEQDWDTVCGHFFPWQQQQQQHECGAWDYEEKPLLRKNGQLENIRQVLNNNPSYPGSRPHFCTEFVITLLSVLLNSVFRKRSLKLLKRRRSTLRDFPWTFLSIEFCEEFASIPQGRPSL